MTKKRGQGEGSIYKRKDGLWSAQISIQGERISKYFKSQREALAWIQHMRNQIQAGISLTGSQMTVSIYMEQWLGSIRESVRSKTLHQYTQIVHQHILPRLGKVKIKDLNPAQIQALYNEKLDTGIGPRTVTLIHAVLHKALKQALLWGIIGRNPSDAVSRPRFNRKEMKTLNDTQVRSLLMVSKGTRFEALFWMAVATGLRQGELLGLRWSDLDWQTRRLHVQRQLQRIQAGLVFCEPKSASGRRVIVLGEETIRKLRQHLDLQLQEIQIAGNKWKDNDLVFPSSCGTPMDHRNLYRHYKILLKEAGLPDIRFHDLRHTAATLMLQQGIHPKVVQERLGHSDISLTLNTYSHVLPAMQEEAAEKLDALLTPIDISKEINHLEERVGTYQVRSAN